MSSSHITLSTRLPLRFSEQLVLYFNKLNKDEITVYTREHTMKQLKMFRSKFDREPTKEEEMKIISDERDKFEDQKAQTYIKT